MSFELAIFTEEDKVITKTGATRTSQFAATFEISKEDYLEYFREKSSLDCIFEGISKFTTLKVGNVIRVQFYENGVLKRSIQKPLKNR